MEPVKKEENYCYIAEQGDLGLFGEQLNESDNEKVKAQEAEDTNK